LLGIASPVFAHVTVKPAQVGAAAFQTFTIGVPNEKDIPTVALRLVIPDGLHHVSPNVKPGWNVTVKKTGDGEDAMVTEINWTGGSIPSGQRDDFLFSAQVPATETKLQWKAYQTYQGGQIVSWDQAPVTNMSDEDKEKMEQQGLGPYSETSIVNDLKPAPTDSAPTSSSNTLSIAALAISVVALGATFKRKS